MQKMIWSKGEFTKAGWVNSGWKKIEVAKEEKEKYKKRPTVINDVTYSFPKTEMDMFQDIQNEIQYGLADVAKDRLSFGMRQIFESTDDWHITKANKLFRIQHPITQAKEGQWGSDTSEADLNILEDQPTIARIYLEQSGLISLSATQEQIADVFGSIEAEETVDKGIQETGFGTRMDIDINRISTTPEEATAYIGEEELEEDMEFFETEEEEIATFSDPRMVKTALPVLPDEVLKRIESIKKEFDEFILKVKDDTEREQLNVIFEKAIDREINPYITFSINSPLCGRGYSAPKRKYDYIDIANVSESTIAANERINFFFDLFNEAADCSTFYDLFGNRTTYNGFYGKIRNMNAHDKELSNKWSILDRKDKDGNVILSALSKARFEYINKWRQEEKGDEESLRLSLWALFDRVASDSSAKYFEGKKVQSRRRYKDSIWRQKRTVALQDLFLTKAQWNAIYNILGIVKNRIALNNSSSKERTSTLTKLKDYFIKVQNLSDLDHYVQWAKKRKFIYKQPTGFRVKEKDGYKFTVEEPIGNKYNTFVFKPSLLDRISTNDETIWRKAVSNKRKFLLQQLFLFNEMSKNMTSVEETDLPEITVACHDHRCDCMTAGKPQFAKLDGDKGQLFILCAEHKTKYNKTLGCNKPIWLIGYKESAVPVTKEEAIRKFKEQHNA
jgi:hypothetical protein